MTIRAVPTVSTNPKTETIQRALVIRRGGLGDIVLATPTIRALAQRYPGIKIDVLVQKGAASAASGLPYVDKVLELDSNTNLPSLLKLTKQALSLRNNRYDLVLNLQPGFKIDFVARVCSAPTTLIFEKDRNIQPETGRVRHAIDDFLKTLAPLGDFTDADRTIDFAVPDIARQRIDRILAEHRVGPAGSKLVVINPTATRIVNRWPDQSWAALIDRLAQQSGVNVVVIGAGKELPIVRSIQTLSRCWDRVLDLSDRIGLKELGALLERADLFVTGDTGPMHIGAAVGAPVVCLSGAADPDRTGPLTPSSTVLIDRSLECVPCQNKSCIHGDQPACMSRITVEQVIEASRRYIQPGKLIPLAVAPL